MVKTITESILETKQVREAIAEGIVTMILTNNSQSGWDAMIKKGKQNGSYFAVKLAMFLDIVKAIT